MAMPELSASMMKLWGARRLLCRSFFAMGALLAAVLAAPAAWSATPSAPAAVVTHARIRLLPGDLPLAGYFDLANPGSRPLTLTGASSPAFRSVELHRSMEKNGMSSMAPVRHLGIKAGATLRFSPDDYHLMLMRRAKPLRVGDHVPVILRFTGNESLRTMFKVNGADSE
ncbi:MAG: copper chaperone PCu(A)C [Acidiferrobacterales bacterium]